MPRRPSILFRLLLPAALLVAATAARAAQPAHVDVPPDESFKEYVPGAARLEGRLLAPCCWDTSRQTLDIHGSPIANELRREIRTRLRAGETPDAIEADLVNRYTTKILAVPPDSPLTSMGPVLVAGLGLAGLFAASRVAKWRKSAGVPAGSPATSPAAPDEWDARIDQALEDED
ncbi:MAG TPA: cytochrome c-type biogenesis protein CcmH [Polyangiaceae bacterium]|nr:cytochrome c-type biogenesis protein CcmH [Polyangiaceae bacterium]